MQSEQLLRNISPRMALRQRSVCLSVFCIRTLHQVCTRPPSLNIARHSIVKRCLKVPRQVGLSPPTVEELSILYQERLREFRKEYGHLSVDSRAIFANNEVSLKYIETYGFDYDYTLACYTSRLPELLYRLCKERLVQACKYPEEILQFEYDPDFAIRGLHFDYQKGMLMKVDAYQHIELGTVYRGHSPISDEEVAKLYGGTHIPLHQMNSFYGHPQEGGSIMHYLDMFSQPEVTLLADVIEYLLARNRPFHPESVANDCKSAMAYVHASGDMHSAIANNTEQYIHRDPKLAQLLDTLRSSGKNLFLITNSSYQFVNKGMCYIVGADWKDLFDVVVVDARKPAFFLNNHSPFRALDLSDLNPTWGEVTKFNCGTVYSEGNVDTFLHLTGWNSGSVLYFGDHVYSDLADPVRHVGWSTGAIVPELEAEVTTGTSAEYKDLLSELLTVESFLRDYQSHSSAECGALVEQWKERRKHIRVCMKSIFNPRFGSMFRTRRGPSYFTRRLIRLSNIYTSSVTNLLRYPLDHAFYTRRYALPHELAVNFGI